MVACADSRVKEQTRAALSFALCFTLLWRLRWESCRGATRGHQRHTSTSPEVLHRGPGCDGRAAGGTRPRHTRGTPRMSQATERGPKVHLSLHPWVWRLRCMSCRATHGQGPTKGLRRAHRGRISTHGQGSGAGPCSESSPGRAAVPLLLLTIHTVH